MQESIHRLYGPVRPRLSFADRFTADNGLERRERIVLKQVEIINSDGQTEYRTVPTYQGSFK